MKNRQLMRLNKVSHNSTIKTVDLISPSYISFIEDIKNDDNFGNWVSLNEVEFIPLTEEILLKCGFDKVREYFTIYNEFDVFKDNKGYYTHINCGNIYLNSIHQLQNLYYALTGEELQINL